MPARSVFSDRPFRRVMQGNRLKAWFIPRLTGATSFNEGRHPNDLRPIEPKGRLLLLRPPAPRSRR